ncbi:uncharacterized protein STEHIDRAFT_152237 [Stereum hirsutum FP-91666 SS1]|uniref:uncharacterized protein n=1 Tax=Stereum hirsutum (strain FP-91666) TaxID=721885 RepID=UPI000440B35D|nr:uncharacterized protein STEHIDRAFT_152237 [Stereum hirsutum FP-91666 SS1]EIM92944.1 hypothetical protein STEHIDRAFT_152237 [Stereum hirsutum FP-91666 SS1]
MSSVTGNPPIVPSGYTANISAPSATKGVKELESQLPKQENPLKTEANKAGLMAPGKQGTTANPNMPSEPRERK